MYEQQINSLLRKSKLNWPIFPGSATSAVRLAVLYCHPPQHLIPPHRTIDNFFAIVQEAFIVRLYLAGKTFGRGVMYTTCKHIAKRPLKQMLTVAMLAMIVHSHLYAQTIDTTKIEKKATVPPVQNKGVNPETLGNSNISNMRIAGVSVPTVSQTTQVSIQGRGRVRRTELSYFVSVRNDGSLEENYRIVTEVLGGAVIHRSPQNRLLPGKFGRQNIRFLTEFSLPAGSNQLQFNVILLDDNGVEIDRTERQADMTEALASLNVRAAQAVTRTRDLAVTEMILFYRRGRFDVGPVNVVRERKIQAAVTVRNVGSERWGYPASLTVSYQMGQPGTLRPLNGPAGITQPQTFALPPGEQTVVTYDAPDSLTPGYYYTATAQVTSRDDQNRANNSQQLVFFLETDGRITPITSE